MTDDERAELLGLVEEHIAPHVREMAERGKTDHTAEAHAVMLLFRALGLLGLRVQHGNRMAIVKTVQEGRADDVRVVVSAPALPDVSE